MNKQQLITLAKRNVDKRRQLAQDKVNQVLAQLDTQDDWHDNEEQLKSLEVELVLTGNESLQKEIEQLRLRKQELLTKYNLSQKDVTVQHQCTKCNDTGYVLGQPCSCLKNEMTKILVEQSNVANKDYTFANSTETNPHNVAVYNMAQKSIDANKNILLVGSTGNGKTYLLTACANYCISKNKSTLLITASMLNKTFLDIHTSDLSTKSALWDSLVEVDALAIDDLGTESVYKNVTAEYLYALINDRYNMGKPTFVSTNLTLQDIRERYDERIFSRLVNQKTSFVAQLQGDDKRLQK